MAKSNAELAQKISNNTGLKTITSWEAEFSSWLRTNQKRLQTLSGSKNEADRLTVTVLHVMSRQPALMECKFQSVMECLMHSASLRLFPGPMQECAYLPFKGVATFVPMYPGLCKLAYNSGHVKDISYNVVYEADEFEWQEGTDAFLRFRPNLSLDDKDRGKRLYAWSVVKTMLGTVITVKGENFIEGIRKRAPFGNDNRSPWKTDPDAMWIKTVVKQSLKTIPKSVELAHAIELDNASERPDLQKAQILEFDVNKIIDAGAGNAATDKPVGSSDVGSNSSETTVEQGNVT